VVFYFALNVFEASNYLSGTLNDDLKAWQEKCTLIIIPFDYFSISIGLCIASIDLILNMHKYFAKELQEEARRIKVIYLILIIAYPSRGVIFLLLHYKVIEHDSIVYMVIYIFSDIIPLSLIMFYHNSAFTAEIEIKSEDLERAASLVASSTTESQSQPDNT